MPKADFNPQELASHPVWVRGLKLFAGQNPCALAWSHPVWVRGLKPITIIIATPNIRSHPVWVRGLKLGAGVSAVSGIASRTPCGCVD